MDAGSDFGLEGQQIVVSSLLDRLGDIVLEAIDRHGARSRRVLEDVVVLESAERCSSSRDLHLCNHLPLVFLSVIHLTVSIDCVAHKGTHNIDEVLDCANRMICMWVVHVCNLIQDSKKFIISIKSITINPDKSLNLI